MKRLENIYTHTSTSKLFTCKEKEKKNPKVSINQMDKEEALIEYVGRYNIISEIIDTLQIKYQK